MLDRGVPDWTTSTGQLVWYLGFRRDNSGYVRKVEKGGCISR